MRSPQKASWSAVWALTMGVSGLMIAEFLPAGVLTAMAADLRITEGMAGQAVTATSILAVATSLSIAYLARGLDRRLVLLALSGCLVLSCVLTAIAPSFAALLFGRALLGIALGGFWSLGTAIVLKMVPAKDAVKALSILHGGASFSAVLAAPLGSFLGNLLGWRNLFLLAAAAGAVGFCWQCISMPSMKPVTRVKLKAGLEVLRIPHFGFGLLATTLAFTGRFASFTYLRPFLEQETGLRGNSISAIFLLFDVAFFVGTLFVGRILKKNLRRALITAPLLLAAASLALMVCGGQLAPTAALVFFLGILFSPIPVGWSSWAAVTAGKNAETASGFNVAAVHTSSALGAFLGGFLFDWRGSAAVWIFSALAWMVSSVFASRVKNFPESFSEPEIAIP